MGAFEFGHLEMAGSGLVMTFNAVFDESGKYNDCEVVVFGGLIFDPSTSGAAFNRDWATLLRRCRVPLPQGRKGPFLHAVELNSLYTGASGDRATQRYIVDLAVSLGKCVCDYALEAYWHMIIVTEFKALPETRRRRYKDPFYYAFDAGVLSLAKSPSIGADDEISLICDDSDEAPKCFDAFRRLRREQQFIKDKVPVIAFGDDQVYPPLQAADLLAYMARAVRTKEAELWTDLAATVLSKFQDISQDPIPADQHAPERPGRA